MFWYVYADDYDPAWLTELLPGATVVSLTPQDFLKQVFARYGAVLYDSTVANGTFLPSIVTLCGGEKALFEHTHHPHIWQFSMPSRWTTRCTSSTH